MWMLKEKAWWKTVNLGHWKKSSLTELSVNKNTLARGGSRARGGHTLAQ